MSTPLRPVTSNVKALEDSAAVGGMRRPYVPVGKCPRLVLMGRQVRQILLACLNQAPGLRLCRLSATGMEAPDLGTAHAALLSVREELAHLFGGDCVELVSVGDFVLEIRGHLLNGWRAAAEDPERAVTRWMTTDGVLAGLRRHPED